MPPDFSASRQVKYSVETLRCFIAIELPPELKAKLTCLQNNLKQSGGNAARWVESNAIHLTLKFLGNVEHDKVSEITRAMEEAARGIPEFKLEVGELGVFPSMRRIQVVWVGLTGETAELAELVKRLDAALARLGFKPEGRLFTSHLTLGRVRDTASPTERQALGEAIVKSKLDIDTGINAASICLMRSELTPKGAIYTRLGEVKLDNSPYAVQ